MQKNKKINKLHPILPRLFAFLIDLIILGISCNFLAKLIISYTSLNPSIIHLIGSAYCLIYFSMLNSHVSLGKTIGKMVCRIRVADFQGQPISIAQSFFRSAIFILPLCIVGYLEPFAQSSIAWSIFQSIFFCISLACIYLVIFNTNSQQGLHDLLTHTQVLRNIQTIIERKEIWKGHLYFIVIISLLFISSSAWNVTKHQLDDYSAIDPNITNITLHSNKTVIGEATSLNTTLIFDMDHFDNQNQTSNANDLVSKFNRENPNFIAQQGVNQAQINRSIQFGLFKFDQNYVYDIVENSGVISLIYSGEGQSINFVR